jgi:hypothetical protein
MAQPAERLKSAAKASLLAQSRHSAVMAVADCLLAEPAAMRLPQAALVALVVQVETPATAESEAS